MAMIEFVQNYEDLSTDHGYQFKFHCDKCGNGFMSQFDTSAIGIAGSALRVAGSLFGGLLGSAGNSAYEVQRAVGGKAHDDALAAAAQEGKQHFHQCGRCGKWVCPQVCWNAPIGQCTECAPNFQEEFAHAHAQAKADAAREQLQQAAQQSNYVGGVDMSAGSFQRAPAPAPGEMPQGYGYGPRGAPAMQAGAPPLAALGAPNPNACAKCGADVGTAKFCADCGTPRAPSACKCGASLKPAAKFCGECGAQQR
jgi:hypothetical protein